MYSHVDCNKIIVIVYNVQNIKNAPIYEPTRTFLNEVLTLRVEASIASTTCM